MADDQPKTTSGAIFNPRSAGTTGIGSTPPVEVGSGKPPRSRATGGSDTAILAVFTVLVLVAAGFMLYRLEAAALVDPVARAERGEVTASTDIALTQPDSMAKALALIDSDLPAGGYIESFRLAPDRINAIVVDPSGRRRTVAINPGMQLTSTDAGTADAEGLAPSDIPVDVPSKIIEQAQRRYGLQPGDLDYMVATIAPEPTWVAFWKQPLKDNLLVAQLDGSQLRRPGEPTP
ncbi:MAG: hypothetical protein QOG62_2260 [Thermoleophilaceae bacterium]|jgi:hypothetical protein|nr:hypothetical protein [Thermoleophilaceae bacterium]